MRELYRRVFLMLCTLSLLTVGCGAGDDQSDDDSGVSVENPKPTVSPLVPLEPTAPESVMIGDQMAWTPPGPPRLSDVPENLLEFIERGKRLMAGSRFVKKRCAPDKKVRTWKDCLGNNYLLAVVSPEGKLEKVDVYNGVAESPTGFTVRCEREGACEGGVNPPFIVSSPPGWTVVAVRKAIHDKDGPDGIGGKVYVPYSTRLNTPELRQAGLEYLHLVSESVRYDLLAKDVRSNRISGKHILETATLRHAVVLSLTEQVYSPELFTSGEDLDRLEMLNRVLVLYALNREEAFRYVMSNMSARGAWQIIPSSYGNLVTMYPAAQLPTDFVEGTLNHHSALTAALLHTDDQWGAFNRKQCATGHIDAFLQFPNDWGSVFAAGYNGPMWRADEAYHECGDNWRDKNCCKQIKDPAKRLSCTSLRGETHMYIPKYEWIDQVLFSPEQRALVEVNVWPLLREQALVYETARQQRTIEDQVAQAEATDPDSQPR